MTESLPAEAAARRTVSRTGGAWRDLTIVLIATVVTFLAAGRFNLSEGLAGVLKHFEAYQLDEVLLAVAVLVTGLSWSSWRRSRQAAREMALRFRAQEAVARQRQYFETLFNENLSANLIADGDGRITLANPELARLFGLERAGLAIGRRLAEFYATPEAWSDQQRELDGTRKFEQHGLRIRRADGGEAVVIARLLAAADLDGHFEIHAFFTDVTVLEETRAELAAALNENRRLAQRGIELLEAERRHIARELHDEMGQWLNALKIDAVSIRDRADLPEDVRRTGHAIVELTNHVYDVARSLMRRLRPVALDELGLAPALQYCVDQWHRRHPEVTCTFDSEPLPDSLGEVTNITLYRLVQECLTNITRHANARTVGITLRLDAATHLMTVTVRDDGQGMDPSRARLGLGLVGLRERVEMLGGRLRIESRPGGGTIIEAAMPTVSMESV